LPNSFESNPNLSLSAQQVKRVALEHPIMRWQDLLYPHGAEKDLSPSDANISASFTISSTMFNVFSFSKLPPYRKHIRQLTMRPTGSESGQRRTASNSFGQSAGVS